MRSPWSGAAQLALTYIRPGKPLFFNRPIGPHRRVHSVTIPLATLKDIKNSFGGTVNDAVLAMIGEAMSRWLYERGEAVPDMLRVFAPVSVRDDSQRYQLGNMVSGMVVEVPLGHMTPKDRVNEVSAFTGDLKKSRQAVAAHALSNLANFAPATIQALAGRAMTAQPLMSRQSVVNLVATNIPGPQFPFYTGGAKLLEIWPLVAIYHTLGLNIAIISYDGNVYVGCLADRDLVPDLDDFGRHIDQSAKDYEAAAKGAEASARAKAVVKRKPRRKPAPKQAVESPAARSPEGNGTSPVEVEIGAQD
jgi:WS/DGAT/MGAT family acyltransferase